MDRAPLTVNTAPPAYKGPLFRSQRASTLRFWNVFLCEACWMRAVWGCYRDRLCFLLFVCLLYYFIILQTLCMFQDKLPIWGFFFCCYFLFWSGRVRVSVLTYKPVCCPTGYKWVIKCMLLPPVDSPAPCPSCWSQRSGRRLTSWSHCELSGGFYSLGVVCEQILTHDWTYFMF